MRHIPGKPLSEGSIKAILSLEEEKLYLPSDVAKLQVNPGLNREEYDLLRKRLGRFIRYHTTSVGDARIGRYNAWRGKTWRSFLDPGDLARLEISSEKPKRFSIFVLRKVPRRIWLGIATLLLSTMGVVAYQTDLFSVLQTQGIHAAANQLQQLNPKTPREKFQAAWIQFREGKLEAAEAAALSLLQASRGEKLRADCHYLLGHIARTRGQIQPALDSFGRARKTYEELGKTRSEFLTATEMARVNWQAGQLLPAETILLSAEPLIPQIDANGDICLFYWVSTRVAFARSGAKAALPKAELAVEFARRSENKELQADAFSELAFYLLLEGKIDQGRLWTFRAQETIVALGDTRKHIYNLVNFILLQRCSGQEPDGFLLETVRSYAEGASSADLGYFLDIALNHSCHGGSL